MMRYEKNNAILMKLYNKQERVKSMSNNSSQDIITNSTNLIISNAATVNSPIIVDDGEVISLSVLENGNTMSVLSGGNTVNISISGGVQYVLSGGIDSEVAILNGSQYVIGGTVDNPSLKVPIQGIRPDSSVSGNLTIQYATNTAVQYVSAGGVVNNGLCYVNMTQLYDENTGEVVLTIGEATQYVLDGGTVNNITLEGATQYVSAGGIVNNAHISAGPLVIKSDKTYWPGKQYVYDRGIVNSTYLVQAEQYIYSGAIASNTRIANDGSSIVSNGGIVSDTTVLNGGSLCIEGGSAVGGTVISNGGYLSVNSNGYLGDYVTLNTGGSMTIGLSNGGTVNLIGDTNSGLVISGYTSGVNTSVSTIINGFSGTGTDSSDKTMIDGLHAANVSSVTYPDDDHITLHLLDGTSITLNMIGIKQTGYSIGSDANGNLTMVVCFLSGTMIRMIDGHYAVEDIQVGDTILTYDAQTKKNVSKKVTWVGKQTAHVTPNYQMIRLDILCGF